MAARRRGERLITLLAVTAGVATIVVGALLLRAAIAHQLTPLPYAGMGPAALLAVAFTWLGIMIGFYTGFPSSVCISLLAFAGYVASVGWGALSPRMATQRA